MNSKGQIIIIVMLLISIIINIAYFYKMDQLKMEVIDQVRSLEYDYQSLRSDIAEVSTGIEAIGVGDQWITDIKFFGVPEGSSANQVNLGLVWKFREVEKNADVIVLYKDTDANNWMKESATDVGKAKYRAQLALNPDLNYHYQIIVEGERVTSSDLFEIPINLYQQSPLFPIDIINNHMNNGEVSITIKYEPRVFDFYRPQKAEAIIFKDGEMVETIELEYTDQDEVKLAVDKNASKIELSYVFEDGTVQLNEITPHDEFKEFEYRDSTDLVRDED